MGGFVEALLASPRPVIMELKRHDGHGTPLLGDIPLSRAVASYETAGAPCLSVVTGRWFGGHTGMLGEVAGLTGLPLLQKDFVTRPSQLDRAHDLGASAVLLTAAVLPAATLARLASEALRRALTPFVEVASHSEIEAVPAEVATDGAVAVNNKDIRSREVGTAALDRSLELLPALLDRGVVCPVSASGIDSPEAAAALLRAGYRGLLVGTALLRSEDVQGWMATLGRLAG